MAARKQVRAENADRETDQALVASKRALKRPGIMLNILSEKQQRSEYHDTQE